MTGVPAVRFTVDEAEASIRRWRDRTFLEQELRRQLVARRDKLRQYEMESYAAIGRMVCRGLEAGTRSYVDLGHDPLARYTRVIEVTTPAYLELSE